MAFPTTGIFDLGHPANGFFILGGHYFGQFKSRPMPPELPGSVAAVYKWFLAPVRWPFWCILGCFVAKKTLTPTREVL
jgi:hypothetical protein